MKKAPLIPTLFGILLLATGAQAQERFDTEETVIETKVKPASTPTEKPRPQQARTVRLRVGEVVEVFVFRDKFGVPREAFYLPMEGTRLAQVVKERTGNTDRFYLKGRAKGKTAGGVVLRKWLDSSGFKPGSTADEMRIQAAVKAHPVYIVVE